jgi:aspartyl-tRNA(Asn)/glutamyl-tRNA(Gln) amidotransferase subunit B
MLDKSIRDKYTVVVGLEVHCQLLTESKIYNTDSTAFGSEPNTNVSVITLGHPGTLPMLNRKVAEYAIRMGLACNCEISRFNIFDRKNYFYPDLPKGYQLTQDRTPICKGGYVTINTKEGEKNVTLNRIHIEEDAGKSIHLQGESDTLVDFNRAGVPLIEIVTEPSIRSSEEAAAYLTEVRKIVRYLGICDGNMEEGSMRCDANVSVMLNGASEYGKKVEVKNMNSIRNVQHAIDHEVERQIALLEDGVPIVSETRTYNAGNGKTYGMRTKEELNDYRYFPDPDLSPMIVSEEWLASIRSAMPELPRQLQVRFVAQYGIPAYDAQVLTDSKDVAEYFESICRHTANYKAASNWVMGPVKSYLNEAGMSAAQFPVSPQAIADMIALIDDGKISFASASQKILPELILKAGESPIVVAEKMNLLQDSNQDTIGVIIDQVIREFPLKVEEFRNGKKGIVGMFMGEVMKRSQGKADPKMANELLTRKLKEKVV